MPGLSRELSMVAYLERESPAMRAATVTVEASFDAMGLCTRSGMAVVSNHGYDVLATLLGPRFLDELASHAIDELGHTLTIAIPESIRCHAIPIDVASPVPMYVVAFHHDHESRELALSRAAMREVQQNLRHALQLLSSSVDIDDELTSPSNALTSKEEEVLAALMAGYRVPTIARDFHVSQSTVRSHLRSIFQKYDVHSQAALFEKLLPTSRVS
jgi:DNA-binding CsgD family transcriptional regulator